jgi:hypothetical protein
MNEIPKQPDEGESTLSSGAPPAWETVTAPASRVAPQLPVPPPGYPPPPATPMGQGGYRPVYDGGTGASAPPSGPGYPQNNYGQPNVAEMLAMAALMSRRRRIGRHVVFWMVLCFAIIAFALLHGCMSFMHIL